MKFYLVLLCLLSLTLSLLSQSPPKAPPKSYQKWAQKFNVTYKPSSGKTSHRIANFIKNKESIEEHNQRFESGEVTYVKQLHNFSDLSDSEFVIRFGGVKAEDAPQKKFEPNGTKREPLPVSFDWRDTSNIVSPVKNQVSNFPTGCASSWAFSVVSAIESALALQTQTSFDLSEQQLMDCSWSMGNKGCRGGDPVSAINWITQNGGLSSEEQYPYEARSSRECQEVSSVEGTEKVLSFERIPEGDETALVQALISRGPVLIGLDATSIRDYGSGIFETEKTTSAPKINHGVLVVGYGTNEEGVDYWVVKNSWGEEWGEEGFIRIARNQTGLTNYALVPVLLK